MNKKNKKLFYDILIKMKKEKEDILKEYQKEMNANHSSESSTYPFHSADVGSDVAMLENLSINLNELINEIRLIDEALRKIDDGTYGVCEICEKEIPIKRLKAIPYAKLCFQCKEKYS